MKKHVIFESFMLHFVQSWHNKFDMKNSVFLRNQASQKSCHYKFDMKNRVFLRNQASQKSCHDKFDMKNCVFPIKTTFDFLLSRVKNPQNRVKPCISKNFGPTSKPCPIEVRVL